MTQVNYDTIMMELNNIDICDTNDTTERQESSSFQEDTDEDDIPSSLLSYFETSKSRAAACEKLILEEPEDFFASHHTEDVMKVNEQVVCNPETFENNTFITETEEPLTQDVSVWPNDEGEAGAGESEEDEEESLRSCVYEAEREKLHCEEAKEEEQRRQTEEDFQKELRRIIEAEKLHQRELELMEEEAQEELKQEMQLQQEVIRKLQRQVEEERRRMEEEQRRLKEEEEERKEEEQRRLRDEEEERMKKEAEGKRREEEERKIEEMKMKKGEERRMEEKRRRLKDEEEERKRREEAERRRKDEERKVEEMKLKKEEERKKVEEEKRRLKEEEERMKKEAERKRREEEERRRKDEERKIEEIKLKKEEERKKVEEGKRRMEREEKKIEDEMRAMKMEEEEERRKIEEVRRMEREEEQEMTEEEKEGRKRLEEERKKRRVEVRKEEERTQRKEERKRKEESGGENVEEVRKETEKEEDEMILEMNEEMERKGGNQEEEEEERGDGEGEDTTRNTEEEDYRKSEEREEFERNDGDQREEEEEKDEERNLEEEEEEEGGELINKETGEEIRLTGKETDVGGGEVSEISSLSPGPPHSSSVPSIITQQHHPERSTTSSLPVVLPEHTEQKRLSWMKECVSWSKLSLQNRRKQKASHQEGRGGRRAGEVRSLPPLCADLLLQSSGWKSLREVTTVTLEDLPGCSLSSLSQCPQLQTLTLRRCGLRSLEGLNQLPQLSYIDVQENEICFINCDDLTSLRVLKLNHNKLTSIHGLTGAENLEVLELSHNSITRIAGLESMKRLQKLSLDHNQLISTKGLKEVYTLLHLDCSHNHLLRVEGVESCGLLSTLDLRANSLTETPGLNNQVLLRELRLDDNGIWSLQSLTGCWLPLLQRLSVAQNRITQLPPLSDAVSLSDLDLRFNCLSELQNVSESLEGCLFLRELHLSGNPLQQESGWSSTLQRALPSLRAIDDQETDSFLSPPAVQQGSLPSGSFLALCQAQLQQTRDLQQRHSRELREASSPLEAVRTSCRHFSEALQLAVDQRFAHEYGDTSVSDKQEAAGRTTDQKTHEVDETKAEGHIEDLGIEFTGRAAPVKPNRDDVGCSFWTSEAAAGSWHDARYSDLKRDNNQHLRHEAAVVIQQLWRKHKKKCGNITGGEPESGPAFMNRRGVGEDYAATVIQAVWRGCTLRRRLASALAAVTCSDAGEDDTFEEVDVNEFVFDEAALEKNWTPLCEDPPSRCLTVSEQQLTLKLPEPSRYVLPPQLVSRSKQAWVEEEQEDSGGPRVSPASSVRSKPPSARVPSGLTEKSEKILEEWGFAHSHTALMMLKRAQKMKSKKQQPKKRSVELSSHQFLFRNCSYQMDPAGAQKRRARPNRNDVKAGEADLERVKQDRAQQWLHTQAALPDRDAESVHFLPELSAGVLNGGRVQLVADPGYSERQHHGSGSWANSSLAARPCRENSYPHSNSAGHARKEAPSPKPDSSSPSKKERISFRDNPVQLSGGWGGGKKRDRVLK